MIKIVPLGSLFLVLVVLLYWYFNSGIHSSKYRIICLNGPSSVGKSFLARALQHKLEKPFLVIGIDQMIDMMPEKLNDWHNGTKAEGFSWLPVRDKQGSIVAHEIHTGAFGNRLVQVLKGFVQMLTRQGHYVIVDDVSFGSDEIKVWKKALQQYKVLWVGLTAPHDVLEERERLRGDRKIGSSAWQAERVHLGVAYDVILDTHKNSLEKNVSDILGKLR